MSGDRHLRPDPEGRVAGSPTRLATVLITADPEHAATVAGQHLLQMLVNLLARQFGIVESIVVDIEQAPVHPYVFRAPRIDDGDLAPALLELGHCVGGPSIRTTVPKESLHPTVILHVGEGFDPTSVPEPAMAVAGSGWKVAARTTGPLADTTPTSPNPLGPHLAACIAASFAFKSAYSKHAPVDITLDMWPEERDGPELDGLELPAAYVLGLGAVGAAFGYVLSCAPGLRGSLMAIDPQDMSDTDRNRLLSGIADSVGQAKARLFELLFAGTHFDIGSFTGKWPHDYLGDPGHSVPADLQDDEARGRFRWIISCVDRDDDRANIAARLPRHVLSGSTFGMAAQDMYYSPEGQCECLACRHLAPQRVKVEEVSERLRSLSPSERETWYREYGASTQERAAVDAYLDADDPTCATPGAADLARLGLHGRVDWAVGFVSVAAGVILAARFIRTAILGPEAESTGGSEWRLFFWRDELDIHQARRRPDCPICGGQLSEAWQALWGEVPLDESPK